MGKFLIVFFSFFLSCFCPTQLSGFQTGTTDCLDYIQSNRFENWSADSLILKITNMMRTADERFECLLPLYHRAFVGAGKEKTSQYYFNALANYYFRKGQFDSVRIYLGHSLECDSLLGDSFLLGSDLALAGNLALVEKNYDEAIEQYNYSLSLINPLEKKTNTRAILTNMGVAYFKKGFLETAMAYYKQAYDLIDRADNDFAKEARTILKINMGIILRKQNLNLDALEIFKEVKDSASSNQLFYPKHLALVNLGHTYLNMDSLDQAAETLKEALLFAKKHNQNQETILLKLIELGQKPTYDNLFSSYLDSLALYYQKNQLEPGYDYYYFYGQEALRRGDRSKSQYFFEKAYNLTLTDSLSASRLESAAALIPLYEKQGQTEKALDLLKRSSQEQELLQKRNNSIAMADMVAHYQLDQYQLQLSKVRAEKGLLQQKNRINRLITIFFLLIILCLMAIFWLYRRNIRITRLADKLEKQRLQENQVKKEKEIAWHKKQLLENRLHTARLQKNINELIEKFSVNDRLLKRKVHMAFSNSSINQQPIHEEFSLHYPHFSRLLLQRHPELTTRQLEYCMLIGFGLTNKEIAEILFVTELAVEKSRSRLIKKFQFSENLTLSTFLRNMLLKSSHPT